MLLTTTVYLDFGLGFDTASGTDLSLQTTVDDLRRVVRDAQGEGIYGAGANLCELDLTHACDDFPATSPVHLLPMDVNRDISHDATDLLLLAPIAQRTREIVAEYLLPFDIDVEIANSRSIEDVRADLQLGETDAYMFITDGKVVPLDQPLVRFRDSTILGLAPGPNNTFPSPFNVSINNSNPQLAMAFAHQLRVRAEASVLAAPFDSPEFIEAISRELAWTATHEAVHTFGLDHYNSLQLGATGTVMDIGGTIEERSHMVFPRTPPYLEAYDAFDTVAEHVGLKDANNNFSPDVTYITGAGTADRISITSDCAQPHIWQVLVESKSSAQSTTYDYSRSYQIVMGPANGEHRLDANNIVMIDGGHGDDEIYIGMNASGQLSSCFSFGGDFLHSLEWRINGGQGDDIVRVAFDVASEKLIFRGGLGNDTFYGKDSTFGSSVKTTPLELYGDEGNDVLIGGDGADMLFGGTGPNPLSEVTSTDTLIGNAGNDVLTGGPGFNVLDGGLGEDVLGITGAGTHDRISITSDCAQPHVWEVLVESRWFSGSGDADYTRSYQVLWDSSGGIGHLDPDDTFMINGGYGDDQISVGMSASGQVSSCFSSGAGYFDDIEWRINGGQGDDVVRVAFDAPAEKLTFSGGLGNDTFYGKDDTYGSDVKTTPLELFGDEGNDVLFGGDGSNVFYGGFGEDTLYVAQYDATLLDQVHIEASPLDLSVDPANSNEMRASIDEIRYGTAGAARVAIHMKYNGTTGTMVTRIGEDDPAVVRVQARSGNVIPSAGGSSGFKDHIAVNVAEGKVIVTAADSLKFPVELGADAGAQLVLAADLGRPATSGTSATNGGRLSNVRLVVTPGGEIDVVANQHLHSIRYENGGTITLGKNASGNQYAILNVYQDGSASFYPAPGSESFSLLYSPALYLQVDDPLQNTSANEVMSNGVAVKIRSLQYVQRVSCEAVGQACGASGLAHFYSLGYANVGDANVDGAIDGADHLIWDTNKFSSLTPSVNGWALADFNGDDLVDVHDFNLWNLYKGTAGRVDALHSAMRSGTYAAAVDYNQDGVLSAADRSYLLAADGFRMGDANLDGSVDGQDFNIVFRNLYHTGTYWSQGDFDGNGITNLADYVTWIQNRNVPGGQQYALGDLNWDGVIDSLDIDMLSIGLLNIDTSVLSNSTLILVIDMYDLNNDGIANEADRDWLVEEALGTAYGDTNLDGIVNFADYVTLNNNYGSLWATWARGDFNGDGLIDDLDVDLLFAHWGFGL
jgi:hypothetical protein